MATVAIKRGTQDNVITYEHICDTTEDMDLINPKEKTFGSTCIVLEGDSGGLEVYMLNSHKEWISLM